LGDPLKPLSETQKGLESLEDIRREGTAKNKSSELVTGIPKAHEGTLLTIQRTLFEERYLCFLMR